MAMGERRQRVRRRILGEFAGYGSDQVQITLSTKAEMFDFPVSKEMTYEVTAVEPDDSEEPTYLEIRAVGGE